MEITFIGNCQTASLCFYFQQLLDPQHCNISWTLYGNDFLQYLGNWSEPIRNKIFNYDESIVAIKNSDIIIFQEICINKSLFSNTETLNLLKKNSCKLIKIPSICMDYTNYDTSILELKKREIQNNVNITVSDIFEKYKDKQLMVSLWHPNTFLFLEIVDEICKLSNIETFSELKRKTFLQDENYMKLP